MCDCVQSVPKKIQAANGFAAVRVVLFNSRPFNDLAVTERVGDLVQMMPIQCAFCPFCGEKYELPKWVNCAVRKPTWEDASEAGEVWYSHNGRDMFRQDWRVVAAQENVPLEDQRLNQWYAIPKNLQPIPPQPIQVNQ